MNFFWVNLGTSYKEVAVNKFLWAPADVVGKNGKKKTNVGWDQVQKVKAGDVIFCHRAGNIIFVAVALKDAYSAKRPETGIYDQWNDDGFRIDVDLTPLTAPVSVAGFKPTLIAIHNQNCSPVLFTKTGGTAQQYMVHLPSGAGALILSYLGDVEIKVSEQSFERQKGSKLSKGSNRETIIQARVGQGQFRQDVLSIWKNTCPVTGLAKPELLVASHIVPWSLSDETQKIDPNNGFPFSPAVDKLFDKGYISFNDNGQLLFKKSAIDSQDLKILGLLPNTKILGLNTQQIAYLAEHRKLFHFNNLGCAEF
jgi:putative restriction endonuclease